MHRRHPLVGLLLLYVALDFGNPMMPGAFEFEPTASVEGVRAERGRTNIPAILPAPPQRYAVLTAEAPRPRVRARAVRESAPVEVSAPFERSHLPASTNPASPDDDH